LQQQITTFYNTAEIGDRCLSRTPHTPDV